MRRLVVRFHVITLVVATTAIFFAPMPVLEALGIPSSNAAHSLLRVISCLLAVVAASSFALAELPGPARSSVYTAMGIAYAATTLMLLAQQIAIWDGALGAVLVVVGAIHASAFLWLGYRERPSPAAGA